MIMFVQCDVSVVQTYYRQSGAAQTDPHHTRTTPSLPTQPFFIFVNVSQAAGGLGSHMQLTHTQVDQEYTGQQDSGGKI